MVFSILTELCNLNNFRTFLSPPQKESLYPLAVLCIPLPSLPTQPQATTHYFQSLWICLFWSRSFFIAFPTHEVPNSLSRMCKETPADSVRNLGGISVCASCPPHAPCWSWRPWSRRGAAAWTLLQLQARPSLSDVGHRRVTYLRGLGSAGCSFQLCRQPSGGRHCVSNRPLIKCHTVLR